MRRRSCLNVNWSARSSLIRSAVKSHTVRQSRSCVCRHRATRSLGTASFAKVFLAKQGHLANRPVVLKISAIEGTEPQTLAQLQHTHVVPIYSVHEDPRAGLRALCMPYFGGASLSQVLQRVWTQSTFPTEGRELV